MKVIKSGIHTELKTVDAENRKMTIVGSSELLDRDREVLKAEGWDLNNYKKNPVVLFGHNSFEPPIAKAVGLKVEEGNLIFDLEFPEKGVHPFADMIFKLYEGGFMNAASVGFIPKEWTDGEGTPESPRRTYTKQELYELSLVPVPANPEALITSRSLQKAWQENSISSEEWDLLVKKLKEIKSEEEMPGDSVPEEEEIGNPEEEKDFENRLAAVESQVSEVKQMISDRMEKLEELIFELSDSKSLDEDGLIDLFREFKAEKSAIDQDSNDLESMTKALREIQNEGK